MDVENRELIWRICPICGRKHHHLEICDKIKIEGNHLKEKDNGHDAENN